MSATSTSAFASLRGAAGDEVVVTRVTRRWDTGFSGTATHTTARSAQAPMAAGTNVITVAALDGNNHTASGTQVPTASEFVYYLAEGATGPFFDLDILLANPTFTPADVAISYLKPDGSTVSQSFTLGALSRRTVKVDDVVGLEDTAVSAVIRSTNAVPLVVERTMFWDSTHYGGHTGGAVESPQTRWLFGEGSQGFFDTYVLLANANSESTTATVTFLVEGGPNVERLYQVAPTSRLNVFAGTIPELVNTSFSIVVTSALPIIAERAMYFGQRLFEGGHESAGVSEPATTWFHAEGATGAFFDTYILVGNPNATPATLTVTYLTGDGTSLVKSRVVPANGRLTLFVDGEDPLLADAAVSTTVVSDVPVVSERAMYWAGASNTWSEAHNSFGVTATARAWALAEGRVGGPSEFETYVLIANPSSTIAQVRATFLRTTGSTVVKSYDVPPTSRFNIWVNAMVPELANEDFGVLIEVVNDVNVAVERAMYWTSGGVSFAGGTNATAVRLPSAAAGTRTIVSVPGTSNPWLSGMPDGTSARTFDVAPRQSPAQVLGLAFAPGDLLVFAAAGETDHCPNGDCRLAPADGDPNDTYMPVAAHELGAEHGLASLTAPIDSLIGIFLGPDQPSLSPAPLGLNFSTAQSRDFVKLSPLIQQPFFIGDGRRSDGTSQTFQVPVGATRLFLGTMDTFGWYNNAGSLTVGVEVRRP